MIHIDLHHTYMYVVPLNAVQVKSSWTLNTIDTADIRGSQEYGDLSCRKIEVPFKDIY